MRPRCSTVKDLENLTIEGRGTIDGQAQYVWRLNDHDDAYIRDNQILAQALGKPLMRSFPVGDSEHGFFPRMIHLVRCKDVRIAGLSILHSPSWNINPYACERMVIDGVYIYSSPKEAVWADGIDPDGCKDLRISNCTIVTGDDALVFYSSDGLGAGAALRKHHRHQLPSLFGIERPQVLRRHQKLCPQRDHR